MNPQYLQQHPSYGPPPTNATYGELNANLPPKGLQDPQSFPPQKPPLGPPPTGNAPAAGSPYYMKDIHQQNDPLRGPPLQQANQNNLVDQMTNIALSGPPRPPPTQNYVQHEKPVPMMPSLPNMNGIGNKNHYSSSGETGSNSLPSEKNGLSHQQEPQGHKFLSSFGSNEGSHSPSQQMPPYSSQQGPNIPRSTPASMSPVNQQGPIFMPSYGSTAGSQLSGQQLPPYSSPSGPNIPRSTPPVSAPSNDQSQSRYENSSVNQPDLSRESPGLPLNSQPLFKQSTAGLFTGSLASSSPGLVPSSPVSHPPSVSTGSVTSQASNFPSPYKSAGFSVCPPPPSMSPTPPSMSPVNHQALNQNRPEIATSNQADFPGKPPLSSQQSFRGPPIGSFTSPLTSPSGSISGPPVGEPITGTSTTQASGFPAPQSTAQSVPSMNHYNQVTSQNRQEMTSTNRADFAGKPPLSSQQSFRGPPIGSFTSPLTSPSGSISGPPVGEPVTGTSTTQASSFPAPQGSIGGSQFSEKRTPPPPHCQSDDMPKSTAQSVPSMNHYNQVTSQNRPEMTSTNRADFSGKPPGVPLSSQHQQFKGPPLPGQSQGMQINQPPTGPPLYSASGSLSSSRQNLSGMSGQNLHGPPPTNQQCLPSLPNLSRPPVSGPPLTGHHPAAYYGQQGASGIPPLPVQQNLHTQYYPGMLPEQRRVSPLHAHHQNTMNSYGQPNQLSDTSYSQGYSQNYGQTVQNNVYANQPSPYHSGVTSPTSGYQNNSQSQARRLDPEQMPSPIQVIQDDQRTKGGMFITNQKGLVPPLVTTKFTVEDQGNASPRFIRSSMYTVPTTADIIKQTQVPFSIILSPMAQVEEGEFEPPIVDMGELGPVRCHRCKAYMSPFMQFLDAGRRFQCVFCKATTEVPNEYFQHLDHTGYRLDRCERPELMLGTYEFIATKDYCRNNTFPKPPAIIFVIDVSYNTIKSGLINLLCSQMKKIIRNLPVDLGQTKSNMKVGFITYNNTVQFYNLKPTLAQPQMMVVGDVQDVFMPLLDGFLCDPEESEALIDSLMSQIPTMFSDTRETEIILAPAIQAGLEALKASECTGKLMVFHSSLPTAEAPGKLKNRDDRKLLGTEKEKSVIAPQNNFYNNLGQECVGSGCSVDLFAFNNSYVDIATIGQVCRLTGGELYKYTYFQADIDGERLIMDIMNNLNRSVAYDAVMRVRTSTGIRPVDFYGHYYMSNTTDIELASIDSDKAIAVEIKHDDKLTEEEGVYIQAALLYTSCSGVRRLRVINLSLKTSSQMAELYRACDLDAIINYLSKQSVFKVVDQSSKVIKENLHARCAAILASYRKHCASPSSAGQLILPECMKLLPLYINGLVKSDAITGGAGITVDQKSYVMIAVATMPISESIVHVYPRLLPLHDVDPQDSELPPMLRCSVDKFTDDGAYLLENGMHMFLWLGTNLCPQWVQSVFGVQSVSQVDTDRTTIPPLDNPLNKRIRTIISNVQSERRYSMRLTLTKQRDKMEMVLRQFLVEDRGSDSNPGYVDFLCHMHREIRTLLS